MKEGNIAAQFAARVKVNDYVMNIQTLYKFLQKLTLQKSKKLKPVFKKYKSKEQ